MHSVLNQLGFLEDLISAIFSNSTQSLGRDIDRYVFAEFWYKNTALLEVRLAAGFTTWVKLRRSGAVTVSSPDLGLFAGYFTLFCHKPCLSGGILTHKLDIATITTYDSRVFMEQVFIILALILSIVLHEMAHGYAANWLGDPTARLQGRLSANPLVHIDPLGSVVVPGLLFLSGAGILFGWAKPVPYNPYNLSDQRYGEAKVAAAGPAVNIALALLFGILIRLSGELGLSGSFVELASYIVYINILLAFFNMIPIPPLDGSKILTAILPFGAQQRYREITMWVERYGLFVTFAFIFIFINVLWVPFSELVFTVFELFTGLKGL